MEFDLQQFKAIGHNNPFEDGVPLLGLQIKTPEGRKGYINVNGKGKYYFEWLNHMGVPEHLDRGYTPEGVDEKTIRGLIHGYKPWNDITWTWGAVAIPNPNQPTGLQSVKYLDFFTEGKTILTK